MRPPIKVVGIDLAGSSRSWSGWAFISDDKLVVKVLRSDGEILQETFRVSPLLVAIDAPLTTPSKGIARPVDLDMRRKGYPVLPPLFPGMKDLTNRAIRLKNEVVQKGIEVVEVHPLSSRRALALPLKEWEKLREALKLMGFKGDIDRELNQHELDAVVCAYTGSLYLINEVEIVGDREAFIVLPKPGKPLTMSEVIFRWRSQQTGLRRL
ncbi:MAG: DUF429 domain-containing protein [Candidatus Nezhaarchaeales archaeon]